MTEKVVYDNCITGRPPRRFKVPWNPSETVGDLRKRIAEITKHKEHAFRINHSNKPIECEDGTIISTLDLKSMLTLTRKPDSKDEDFFEEPSQTSAIMERMDVEKNYNSTKPASSTPTKETSAKSCGICLEDDVELKSVGNCAHRFCATCLAKYLSTKFDDEGKSFLDIPCPGGKCGTAIDFDTFKANASESTLKHAEVIFRTVPQHPEDPNLSIGDFGYKFDVNEKLVHAETGEKFHWVNQAHYDLLGDMIVPYIQQRIVKEFGFQEIRLPSHPNPPHAFTNIFVTPDLETNKDKLMLLIQGSGAVRAGQWARALCINDSLKSGSIIPYIVRAREEGYAIVVFNPNLNAVPKKESRPSHSEMMTPGKPSLKSRDMIDIDGHKSSLQHTITIWDTIASQSPAKHIVIVAHSAGGHCTTTLLRDRQKDILPRLKAVAFTDSVHSISPKDPAPVRKFLKSHAKNWVMSSEALDTPCHEGGSGCPCVSSGHEKHEHTSYSAIESVFKFLKKKVEEEE
eukprot:TRINITY_DN2378_c1_g1_i2.p1 TRINITY_DN2378_c1_g1~~TRINITY_DN2378_c1_g1_i2.p1  ORF type:complete len:528 (-),score=126.03 TRINITY_DN2378_c1_g1_i2:269-1810(-)